MKSLDFSQSYNIKFAIYAVEKCTVNSKSWLTQENVGIGVLVCFNVPTLLSKLNSQVI